MSGIIVQENLISPKFTPDEGKIILNHSETLKNHLSEANLMLDGLSRFFQAMQNWQTQEKISLEEFDQGYIFLCKAGLITLLDFTIDDLYIELTGRELEEEDLERLWALEDEHVRGDMKL